MADYPLDSPLHALFEETVRQHPDAIALDAVHTLTITPNASAA